LYRAALAEPQAPAPTLLREAYGIALRTANLASLIWAGDALLECVDDDREIAAILRERYELQLATRDFDGARGCLQRALAHESCRHWAPRCAVTFAALRQDYPLLADAQHVLATQCSDAGDLESAAAHESARARALWRAGDPEAALGCAKQALELSPGHAYAVALTEELLIARGDATDAAHMLREAAAVARTAEASELALLHAGCAAELAGRADLAAQSYEEAAQLNPTALAPLWSLQRLAEHTGNAPLELAALEGLAQRESTLDRAGAASVELAERYDSLGQPQLAAMPLTAALTGERSLPATTLAMLAPQGTLSARTRADALASLETLVEPASFAFIARERIADAMHDDPAQ
jgi:tetratricopeptide (TPR) repeat protein